MFSVRAVSNIIFAVILSLFGIASAFADFDPNDNYSSLVLSYKNSTFDTPVCIGDECHEGVSGPAAIFSQQLVSNLALGISGSYMQSTAKASRIKSSNFAVFAQLIAGLGYRVDVGASIAALNSSMQLCSINPSDCTSSDDNGGDVGVFGKVFLSDMRNISLKLSYDAINFEKAPPQSIVALSLVSIIAKHHRFDLSIDRSYDSNGYSLSNGYGLGYSYLVF